MAQGSLKTRLILVNTAILAALLLGSGYLMQSATRSASLRLLDRGLMARAQEIAKGPVPGLESPMMGAPGQPFAPPNPEGFPPREGDEPPIGQPRRLGARNGLGPGPRGQGAGLGLGLGGGRGPRNLDFGRPVWIDRSGKVLAPAGRTAPWSLSLAKESLAGIAKIETAASDEGDLRVASVPIRREGQIIGAVQVVQPMEGLNVSQAAAGQVFLWFVPLGVAGAAGAVWLVLRNSMAPVERATQAAEAIASTGRLGERLPVAGTDEMAQLSQAFNRMIERLEVTSSEKDLAMKRLSTALEEQKRFTADASHELRTPLASLRLSIQGLKEGAGLPEESQKQLDLMDGVSRGMARLVDDLLTLARADSGNLRLAQEPLDLKKPLAEALLVHGLGDSEWVQVAFPDGALMGVGDEDAVRRIAVNLLANAKRHCPEGALGLGGKIEGPWAVFWVQDSGEGMTQEEADQAGTRFYRADAARARDKGGHGLGLAICRSLAEAMGGGLKMTSEKGKGALVQVWVPASSPPEPQSGQSRSS